MKVWFVSNDIVNTAKLQSQIVQDRHTPSLKIYIMKKTKWNYEQFESVDWTTHSRALHSQIDLQRVGTTKFKHLWVRV